MTIDDFLEEFEAALRSHQFERRGAYKNIRFVAKDHPSCRHLCPLEVVLYQREGKSLTYTAIIRHGLSEDDMFTIVRAADGWYASEAEVTTRSRLISITENYQ